MDDVREYSQDTTTCIAIIERDLETTLEPSQIGFTDIVEKAIDGIFNTVWDVFNRGVSVRFFCLRVDSDGN